MVTNRPFLMCAIPALFLFLLNGCSIMGPEEASVNGDKATIAPQILYKTAAGQPTVIIPPAVANLAAMIDIMVVPDNGSTVNQRVPFSTRRAEVGNVSPGAADLEISVLDASGNVLMYGIKRIDVQSGTTNRPQVTLDIEPPQRPYLEVSQLCDSIVLLSWASVGYVTGYNIVVWKDYGSGWVYDNDIPIDASDTRFNPTSQKYTIDIYLPRAWQNDQWRFSLKPVNTAADGPVSNDAYVTINLGTPCGGAVYTAPSPLTPTNGDAAVGLTPMISWSVPAGALSYWYEVALDNTFSSVVASGPVTAASASIGPLDPGTFYYWHVYAWYAGSNYSDWSEVYTFTTMGTSGADNEGSIADPVVLSLGAAHTGSVNSITSLPCSSYYAFTTTIADTYDIAVSNVDPTGADIDFYLYDDAGFSHDIYYNTSSSENLGISGMRLDAGIIYYLKIYNYGSAAPVTYSLVVSGRGTGISATKYRYKAWLYGHVPNSMVYVKIYPATGGSQPSSPLATGAVDSLERSYIDITLNDTVDFGLLDSGSYWIYAYNSTNAMDDWATADKKTAFQLDLGANITAGLIRMHFSTDMFSGYNLTGSMSGSISGENILELYYWNENDAIEVPLGFYYCLNGNIDVRNLPSINDLATFYGLYPDPVFDAYYFAAWSDEDFSFTFNAGDKYYYNSVDSVGYFLVGDMTAPLNVGALSLDYTASGAKRPAYKQPVR